MMPLLPDACSTGLTFARESIAAWTVDGDLARFVRETHQIEDARDPFRMASFHEGQRRVRTWAREFFEEASRYPSSVEPADQAPDFEHDPVFGWMAKHAVAFTSAFDALRAHASGVSFVSWPHLLETDSALRGSVLLASRMHYKQAFEALRGVIEVSMRHAHLTVHPDDIRDWLDGTWSLPPLCGPDGWLATLTTQAGLPMNVDEQVRDLYAFLGICVHATEMSFVQGCPPDGAWSGSPFRRHTCDAWCAAYARTVAISLGVLALLFSRDAADPEFSEIMCLTCGQVRQFHVMFRKDRLVRLRCPICLSEKAFLGT